MLKKLSLLIHPPCRPLTQVPLERRDDALGAAASTRSILGLAYRIYDSYKQNPRVPSPL